RKQIVVAITGASGAIYARRLIECLATGGADIHLVISPHGRQLLADELNISSPTAEVLAGRNAPRVQAYGYNDVGSRLPSGPFRTDGMIVCPCSSNTLAEIASGTGSNLITRAAHVHLKEMRRLIVVPREMPLSRIEIENMLRISQAGGVICPAAPGFYMLPSSVDHLVDFVVGKLLDLVGVPHDLNPRWQGGKRPVTAAAAEKA